MTKEEKEKLIEILGSVQPALESLQENEVTKNMVELGALVPAFDELQKLAD